MLVEANRGPSTQPISGPPKSQGRACLQDDLQSSTTESPVAYAPLLVLNDL
jgi:hypothetical protein